MVLGKLFSPRYLLYTNTALGMGFYALCDSSQQTLNRLYHQHMISPKETPPHSVPYDVGRTGKKMDRQRKLFIWYFYCFLTCSVAMAKTGVILGLAGHYWYKYLDWRFSGTRKNTLIKKLIAEMIAGPPFALMTFLFLGFFESKNWQISIFNYKDNLVWICLVCSFIWIKVFLVKRFLISYFCAFRRIGGFMFLYNFSISNWCHRNIDFYTLPASPSSTTYSFRLCCTM